MAACSHTCFSSRSKALILEGRWLNSTTYVFAHLLFGNLLSPVPALVRDSNTCQHLQGQLRGTEYAPSKRRKGGKGDVSPVALKLEWESDSAGGLVKTDCFTPHPELVIQ